MPRGRPPKPTKLKLLSGNPGKRPLNKAEPQPQAETPQCPEWLDDEAKQKWEQLAPELARMGLLTIVDGDALACYCQAWAEFKWATEQLNETGRTSVAGLTIISSPAVAQQRSAWKTIREFASLFGLDPSSRSRLNVGAKGREKDGGKKRFFRNA